MKKSLLTMTVAVLSAALLSACGPEKTPEQEAADYAEAAKALSGAMVENAQVMKAISQVNTVKASDVASEASAPVASAAE